MTMMRRLFGSVVAILVLCGAIFAQQAKIYPLSDTQYRNKDYPRYLEIKKETDAQKRADLLVTFVKERPVSKILINVVNDYMEGLKPFIDKKDWVKVIAMEEAIMALLPTEQSAQAAIPEDVEETVKKQQLEEFQKTQLLPSRSLMQRSLLAAFYQSSNWIKAAEIAEKMYAASPDKDLMPVLADIYLKMQNYDKYLDYGKKILSESTIEKEYPTAIQMAQIYIQKQDVNAATDLLSKVLDVYGDKVPASLQEAQWNPTRAFAYGVIAQGIYAKKDYPKALELYEKVLKFDPKRDDAHYFVGMSKWQSKDTEGAMEPFAKCMVLNKTYAKKAQQYLEQIYKARNKDSLDGLDKILAKAKADLGIS
jgi:tetratricopeptide (TPR) repeat protein